jgi:hypothetical protein
LRGRPKLDDLAGIEDGDALADRADGADVVAYEHDGNAFLLLQVAEQAEDLEQQVMQLMERASRGWGKPLRIDRSKLATTTE